MLLFSLYHDLRNWNNLDTLIYLVSIGLVALEIMFWIIEIPKCTEMKWNINGNRWETIQQDRVIFLSKTKNRVSSWKRAQVNLNRIQYPSDSRNAKIWGKKGRFCKKLAKTGGGGLAPQIPGSAAHVGTCITLRCVCTRSVSAVRFHLYRIQSCMGSPKWTILLKEEASLLRNFYRDPLRP